MDIWVGYDGSAGAARALRWAGSLALRTGACIRPINAWHLPLLYSVAAAPYPDASFIQRRALESLQTSLTQATALLPDGIDIMPLEMSDGSPRRVMPAATSPEDLLVVGSRGLGSATGLALGSVASAIVSHAQGPVAIVPNDWSEPTNATGKPQALIAIADSPHDQETVRWTARNMPDHALRLIHAWVSPFGESFLLDMMSNGDYRAERRAREFSDRALRIARYELGPDADIEGELVEGSPVAVISEAAMTADVLVLGAQRFHGLERLLLGSVAQGVIHDLRVPTIIVPEVLG